jgi:nicotinamidase-related amidase
MTGKTFGNSSGKVTLSEKGLLTPDNCVVVLIDLQPQMLFGVSIFDRQSIINNNLVLSKAARVFDVPVILSTVETKAFSGKVWPQMLAGFPGRGQASHRAECDARTAERLDPSRYI